MDLLSLIEDLKKRIKDLEEEISVLRQENVLLRRENDRLKERLGLNSMNSSLPPSRDLYALKKKNRVKSERKPGGQPGHKSHQYERGEPDEIIMVHPETCSCGQPLKETGHYRAEQKIDIPPIKPIVTEYRLMEGVCGACGKKKRAPLPKGVQQDLLGPHAKAIIGALSGFFHNSKRDVQDILKSMFGLSLSLGLISATEKRVSQHLKKYYEKLKEEMEESAYLHVDETGHRRQGKRGWAWILTSRDVSVLKLADSRGKKVLEALLPAYEGFVISDRYGAYSHFEEEKRQVCWFHLKRDFERFAHSRNEGLAGIGKRLVKLSEEIFTLERKKKEGKIERVYFGRRIRKVQKKMRQFLKRVKEVPEATQGQRVGKNLLKSFEMMWRFVEEPSVEMTNNLAERQLRKYVVYRKKSLFTWSQRGDEFVERTQSLFLTSRLRKENPFELLSYSLILQP